MNLKSIAHLRVPFLAAVALSLGCSGCDHPPKSATNGIVSVTLSPHWTAFQNPDGHLSLNKKTLETLVFPHALDPDGISIHTKTNCLSDEQARRMREGMQVSLRNSKPTPVWFDISTQSRPLSCLESTSPSIGNIPTDLMVCFSTDGVSAIYFGRASVRAEAVTMLQTLKTSTVCSTSQGDRP
jgi:hypothetical protein